MDAAGLRAESEQATIRDLVNARRARSASTPATPATAGAARSPSALENNEDDLRSDPRNRPRRARARAPAACSSTARNNLRQGFERIEGDLRNYYLLGYTPANATFDGRFRNIRGQGEAARRDGRRAQGLLRRPGPGRRRRSTRGKRRRSAPSSRSRCPTPSPSAPARCCFPSADARASCRSSSSSRPRR